MTGVQTCALPILCGGVCGGVCVCVLGALQREMCVSLKDRDRCVGLKEIDRCFPFKETDRCLFSHFQPGVFVGKTEIGVLF